MGCHLLSSHTMAFNPLMFSVFLMGACGAVCTPIEGPSLERLVHDTPGEPLISTTPIKPGRSGGAAESKGVDWTGVLTQSLGFLAIEHGFRYATEEGTRHPHRSFFGGYVVSTGGETATPFYVNYIGHPMQGSVAGFIFVQNDRKYRASEFGKNREYWKSRLRAAPFSWGTANSSRSGSSVKRASGTPRLCSRSTAV